MIHGLIMINLNPILYSPEHSFFCSKLFNYLPINIGEQFEWIGKDLE